MRFWLLMTSVVRIWFMRMFARPKKTHEPRTGCIVILCHIYALSFYDGKTVRATPSENILTQNGSCVRPDLISQSHHKLPSTKWHSHVLDHYP